MQLAENPMYERCPDRELSSDCLPLGYVHHVYKELASTMDIADAVLHANHRRKSGLVVQALSQTSGRGTDGRVWQSPQGNLYFSMLAETGGLHARTLALLAVLAVIEAAAQSGINKPLSFKMPNDVLLDGKKVCGILAEESLKHSFKTMSGKSLELINMGIGINVHTTPSVSDSRNVPTSLGEYGWQKTSPAEAFLATVLHRFEHNRQCALTSKNHVFLALGAMRPYDAALIVRDAEGRKARGVFDRFETIGDDHDYLVMEDGRRFRAATTSIRLLNGKWTGHYPYPL